MDLIDMLYEVNLIGTIEEINTILPTIKQYGFKYTEPYKPLLSIINKNYKVIAKKFYEGKFDDLLYGKNNSAYSSMERDHKSIIEKVKIELPGIVVLKKTKREVIHSTGI
jgi:hypothetical protein